MGSRDNDAGLIGIGSLVVVRTTTPHGGSTTRTFHIVPPRRVGVELPADDPAARALLGHRAGDRVKVPGFEARHIGGPEVADVEVVSVE